MDWNKAEETLQEVGLFLLALDNADGLRKGLAQPDRKPSPLTEKVFALMKEVRDRRLIPPKNNLRRVCSKAGVGHALTVGGKVVCGARVAESPITPGGLRNEDCKRCLGVLKKLGVF